MESVVNSKNNIDLILKGTSKWIVNWGILAIMCIFFILLVLCYHITYSQYSKCEITCLSEEYSNINKKLHINGAKKKYGLIVIDNKHLNVKIDTLLSFNLRESNELNIDSFIGKVIGINYNKRTNAYEILIDLSNLPSIIINKDQNSYKINCEMLISEQSLLEILFAPLKKLFC